MRITFKQYKELLDNLAKSSKAFLEDSSEENKKAFYNRLEQVKKFEKEYSIIIESKGEVLKILAGTHVLVEGTNLRKKRLITFPRVVTAVATVVTIITIAFFLIRQDKQQTEHREPLLVASTDFVPMLIVLDVDGEAQYRRAGWNKSQNINPGTQLQLDDTIALPGTSTLAVICPDGTLQNVSGQDLNSNQAINCPSVNTPEAFFAETTNKTVRQRGPQDPTRPTVLSPRGTVIRTSTIDIQWNTLPTAQSYTVTIFSDAETVYKSGNLSPSDISTSGDVASISVELDFQENTPYTTQVCAFVDNQSLCSLHNLSNPEISNFYYHDSPQLNNAEATLNSSFEGRNPEELLYARAVLLSGPLYQPLIREAQVDSRGEIITPAIYGSPIGYYAEALELLNRIISDYPNSQLQSSPDFHILRGNLLEQIGLAQQAFSAYERAAELAQPDTLAAAVAALGKANNALNRNSVSEYYNEALTHYSAFLNATEMDELCQDIGVEYCQAWHNKAP